MSVIEPFRFPARSQFLERFLHKYRPSHQHALVVLLRYSELPTDRKNAGRRPL